MEEREDLELDDRSNGTSWMGEELETNAIFKKIKKMYPKWHVLPVDRCDLLRSANGSFWALLNVYSNSTTGSPVSCLEHAPTLDRSSIVQAITLAVMFVISLVGNALMVYSLCRKRRGKARQHSSTIYDLIFHLSIADLLVTVTCLFGEAAWKYSVSWLADDFTCKLLKFSQMFTLYLSTFVLVLIGLDRLTAVKYPMKTLSRRQTCNRLVLTIWILSLLLSSPQLLVFNVHKGPFYEEFYQCVTYGSYKEEWQEHLYMISSIFLMFILPLVIIIWSYVCTFITLTRSEKQFRAELESRRLLTPELNRRRLIHRARIKSVRIFLVIVIAFICCWTPYYFTMIVFQFHKPDQQFIVILAVLSRISLQPMPAKLAEDLQNGIFFFGMSNSLINPVIYGAFHLRKPRQERRNTRSSKYELSLL